jgi:hypothetical protein
MRHDEGHRLRETEQRPLLPSWFRRTVAYAGGGLVVGAAAWALLWVLLKVALITFALLVALLLAALLDSLARLLHRALPAWAAALLSLLLLLAAVTGGRARHRPCRHAGPAPVRAVRRRLRIHGPTPGRFDG